MLSQTKSPTPPHLTQNVVYENPCSNCPGFYDGQSYRPVIKRFKEHEACFRLNSNEDESTGNIKSAIAHHALTNRHTPAWDRTTILTSTRCRSQLDLTEHAAIKLRKPTINRVRSAPLCSQLWDPVLPKIAANFKPRNAGISFNN